MAVPLAWRIGQVFFSLIVLGLALWYNLRGFLDISGELRTPSKPPSDQLGFLILLGIIWYCTPTAGTIALSSLQEAFRRRWVIGFLVFSMVVIGFFSTFTFAQPGEEQGFLKDIGTGFIITMTLLIAVFLGVALVPPEIERRTIFTILSKPVTRAEFLVGKFLGLALTLLLCMVLLGGFYMLVFSAFAIRQEGWEVAWSADKGAAGHVALGFSLQNIFKALILNYGQLIIMSALSLMLSLIVTPVTAITFCFLAFFGGQMSSYWGHLGGEGHSEGDGHDHGESGTAGLSPVMQKIVQVVYYALPRMDHFDVRKELVTNTNVGYALVWKAWSSGLLYVAVLLIVAYLVFSDREF